MHRMDVWFVMLLFAAVAVALVATQPRDVFWGPDSGNHFLQLQSILRGTSPAEVDPGARTVDPRLQLFPTGGHHLLVHGGRVQSFYSPAFPLIAAPLFRAFGYSGLFVIPIASALLLVPLLAALCTHVGLRAWLVPVALAVLFATPILFYSVVFWEHTLTIALSAGAFERLLRGHSVAAGVLAGLGTVFREEGYVVIAVFALAVIVREGRLRGGILLAATAAVTLVPLWTVNTIVYRHPLGLHAVVYHASGAFRWSSFYVYLFEFTRRPLLVAPAALFCVVAVLPIDATLRVALYAIAAAASTVLAVMMVTSRTPLLDTLTAQGFVAAVPLVITVALSARELWRTSSEWRALLTVILTALVLTPLALNQADMGIVWGPRHFLWLVPLVIVAAAGALQRSKSIVAITATSVLFVASLLMQAHAVSVLRMKLRFDERVEHVLAQRPRAIATDVFWLPEEMSVLFYDHEFLAVSNSEQLAALHAQPFTFVTAPYLHAVSGHQLETLAVPSSLRIRGDDPLLDVILLDRTGLLRQH